MIPRARAVSPALTQPSLGEAGTQRRNGPKSWKRHSKKTMAAHIHTHGDKGCFRFEAPSIATIGHFAESVAEQILDPAVSPRKISPPSSGCPRLHHQNPARQRRRDLGKEALAALMFQGAPTAIDRRHGRRPGKSIALADIPPLLRRPVYPGSPDRGCGRRLSRRLSRELRGALLGLPATGKPRQKLPPSPAHSGAVLIRRERRPRQRYIHGPPAHHHAGRRRTSILLYLAGSYLGEHRTFNGVSWSS